jgi:hypothetical protein
VKQIKAANGRYRTEFEKEDFKRLHKLYVVDQLSIHDTAAKMKVKSNIIQRYVEQKGWVRKKSDMGFTKEQEDEIVRLYIEEGVVGKDIATKYKVHFQTIYNLLEKRNVTRTKKEAHLKRGVYTRNNCINRFANYKHRSFIEYHYATRRLLSSMWPVISYTVDKEGLKLLNSGYSVDHMISVYNAYHRYKKPLPLKVVAHPANLRVVTAKENSDKGMKNCIRLKKLYENIEKYNLKYGDPFVEN